MPRPRLVIPPGSTFGEWTVLGPVDGSPSRHACRCSCGAVHRVLSTALRCGKTRSCQWCANRARGSHLESGEISVEYRAWKSMVSRCSGHASGTDLEHYFGRGITVCDEWTGPGGFQAFLDHVGRRPSSEHSLDRIENDKGYEPGNVRWATPEEQQGNRRNNVVLVIDDQEAHVAEWSRRSGVREGTIRSRLRLGWAPREAVFTPVGR